MQTTGSSAIAVLLFCLPCLADVPSVQGTVVDPSGRVVPGARVECADRSAVSGPDGHFTIPGVGRCRARIRSTGFEIAVADLVSELPARVELGIPAVEERVVVSATRTETSAEEAGIAADVLTVTDIGARQAPGVADLLREVPGLNVARYGRPGSLTEVFSRGGQRTATLVLLDGIPVNDPGGEVNLAGLSSSELERIEVVRGPESALFGAEAASGVVQLFTRRGNAEERRPRGSVSYDRGSFQTDRFSADLAGGSGGRFDYSFGAEQFHSAGEYRNDYFRNTTGSANVGFRIAPSTQARAMFRSFDSALGTPNQVGYGIYDSDASEATRDYAAGVRVEDVRGPHYVQRFSFAYHRSHDLFLDPQAEGPYEVAALVRDVARPVSRTYLERLVSPDAVAPPGLRLVTQSVYLWPMDPYLSLSSRKDAGYQGTFTHDGSEVVFGYDYERQEADITGRAVARDNHGAFVHAQHAAAGRVYFSGGLRLEQNSAFHTKLTPRGAVSFLLAGEHGALSSTLLRFSAGVGITEPSLLQNFARDSYFVGNPALRPEKTISYEAGIVQEWLARRVRTEVSAFDNSFHDLIVFAFLPLPEPSTWMNVNASRSRGLEFSARARITGALSASGSYTRMWTRITRSDSPNSLFTGVGQELARRPGNSAALAVTFAPRRWTVQTGAVLVGERQDTDLFGVTRNRGYQTVYAAGSFRLTRNLVPFARVENLTNERYEEVLGYPALSRNAHGGLRFEW